MGGFVSGSPTNLGVILIHGIGDIAPGHVLRAAVETLRGRLGLAVAEPSRPMEVGSRDQTGDHARVSMTEFFWRNCRVAITEFNWTTAAGKIRLGKPLDALRKLINLLDELPRVGATGAHPRLQKIAVWAGTLQRQLVVAVLVTLLASLTEIALRPDLAERAAVAGHHLGVPGTSRLSSETIFGEMEFARADADTPTWLRGFGGAMYVWLSHRDLFMRGELCTLASSLLYFVIAFFYAALAGFYLYFVPVSWFLGRKPAAAKTLWRILVAGSVVMFLISMVGVQLVLFALGGLAFMRHPSAFGYTNYWEPSGVAALAIVSGYVYLRIAVVVANLLRDVVHYLAPDSSSSPLPHQRRIRDELAALLALLEGRGCQRIVVVAHSLGTVIVTDLLAERMAASAQWSAPPIDLVTAGSPLRRLVTRLLPDRKLPDELRAEFARGSGGVIDRWFNYYRLFDYVGQALTYSALPLDLVGWRRSPRDAGSSIRDWLLTPRFAWPLAHANYWADARFLHALAEQVVLPSLAQYE